MVVVWTLGCGTLIDKFDPLTSDIDGGDNTDSGIRKVSTCVADDSCTCEPCQAQSECEGDARCEVAREHGDFCPDSRLVCSN